MTIPADDDNTNGGNNTDSTVQRVAPEEHHMMQQNMRAHATFVTQVCLDRRIAIERLVPNVILQPASATIQTHFTIGDMDYLLITNTEGVHTFQRTYRPIAHVLPVVEAVN